MEIDNSTSQITASLIGQNVLTIDSSTTSIGKEKRGGFGPAFQIKFSNEAQALSLQASEKDVGNPIAGEVNALLKEVFGGVAEALSFASEAGKDGEAEIKKAGEEFQQEILKIARENNGKPLSEAQVIKILEADEKLHQTVDKVFGFEEMSEEGLLEFDVLSEGEDEEGSSYPNLQNSEILGKDGKSLTREELAAQEAALIQASAVSVAGKKEDVAAKARIALLNAQLRSKKAELQRAEQSEKEPIKVEISKLEAEAKTLQKKQGK